MKISTKLSLRELIRLAMEKCTQRFIAEKIGYSQPTLSGWLNGHRRPRASEVAKIKQRLVGLAR